MSVSATAPAPSVGRAPDASVNLRQLRGSTLLLVGRVLALAVDFAAQVLLVRYLVKAEFGAYSYALAVATLGSTLLMLGLPETLGRCIPMFRERGRPGRAVGAVLVACGAVGAAGVLAVLAVSALPGQVGAALHSDRAAGLLAILVLLIPAEGLNQVLQALFATLGRTRSIFLRQFVVVPLLRFVVTLLLVTHGGTVAFLAWGYVAASVAGLLLYAGLARGALRAELGFGREPVELPWREVIGFASTVLMTSVCWLVLMAFSTVALGVLTDTTQVAAFEAVLPSARLNSLVLTVFGILFVPTVATLYARGRLDDLRDAYRTTTSWLIVLSVPGLALTTALAPSFVPAVFGQRYASSTSVMVILAAAFYVNTAAGLLGPTLRVFGRLRDSVAVDVAALLVGVALNLVLIPRDGARGAAVALLCALVARNALGLWVLRRVTGIRVLNGEFVRLHSAVVTGLAALTAIRVALQPGVVAALALSCAVGLAVLLAARRTLDLGSAFPELGVISARSRGRRFARARRR